MRAGEFSEFVQPDSKLLGRNRGHKPSHDLSSSQQILNSCTSLVLPFSLTLTWISFTAVLSLLLGSNSISNFTHTHVNLAELPVCVCYCLCTEKTIGSVPRKLSLCLSLAHSLHYGGYTFILARKGGREALEPRAHECAWIDRMSVE